MPIFSSPRLSFLWAEVASENCFLKKNLNQYLAVEHFDFNDINQYANNT